MIKEYCKQTGDNLRFILRLRHYGSDLATITELFNEAKKDFPNLSPADAEIVQYGGERYKRTFGIEFAGPKASVPADYAEVKNLELKL